MKALSVDPTHMKYEDTEWRFLIRTQGPRGCFYILLKFSYGVFQSRPSVIHFVNYQYVLADQVGHLKGRQVEPLGSSNLGPRRFDRVGWLSGGKLLIEGKADGLNRDVGSRWSFEKRPTKR